MAHIVLAGDSVFDNAAYVAGGPDVVSHLRRLLPLGWNADLVAVDGAVSADVPGQLDRLPAGATHLVISVGGNDALQVSGVLGEPSRSVAETLSLIADIRDGFGARYAAMLDRVAAHRLPTAVSTIYDPRYPEPQRRIAVTALAAINDVILREAIARGLPVLDLRAVCDDDGDFANPIEPSVQGGAKIASAVLALVRGHDFGRGRTEIFAR